METSEDVFSMQVFNELLYNEEIEPEVATAYLRAGAEQNSPHALCSLGRLYLVGFADIPWDEKRGESLVLRAAEAGVPMAKCICARDGLGCSKDPKEAIRILVEECDSSDPVSKFLLGRMIHDEKPGEAFELYKAAAAKGQTSAMNNLGLCYERGHGTPVDTTSSFYWYERSARRKHSNSEAALGNAILAGRSYSSQFEDRKWTDEDGFAFLQRARERGLPHATFTMGYHYYIPPRREYDRAFALFSEAAAVDYHLAYVYLGACFQNGEGTVKDPDKAFEYFKKAADSGIALGHSNLGLAYFYGWGCEKSDELGMIETKKAMAKGLPSAFHTYAMRGLKLGSEEWTRYERKAVKLNNQAALVSLRHVFNLDTQLTGPIN